MAIGRLGSPRGLHGDLKVHSYSGEHEHFLSLSEVDLESPAEGTSSGGREVSELRRIRAKVLRVEENASGLSMAFKGFETPESARTLTGLDIVVPRELAAPLRENEWYVADLVGLDLVCDGKVLARVASILEGGPDPWLEAQMPDGRRALVPFRKEFVGDVNLAAKQIELLASWLLEP